MKILISCLILILFLMFLDLYYKRYFTKNFPPNILYPIKNDIILPQINKDENIPKVIYRTMQKEKINKYRSSIEITEKRNPEFEQIIYDDEMIIDFIKKHYDERVMKAYTSINPDYGPAKADFFRYLVIYIKGGIYLDIKSYTKKSIKSMVEMSKGKLLVSKGRAYLNFFHFNPISLIENAYNWSYFSGAKCGEYNNWCIAAPKGNPILKMMIKQIISNIEHGIEDKSYNFGEFSVLVLSGPICYTRIIDKYGNDENRKFFSSNMDDHFGYSYVNHKKIAGNNHYSKLENKNILIN